MLGPCVISDRPSRSWPPPWEPPGWPSSAAPDRIELCENDPQGGTTPSAGTIETVLELAEPHGTPVHVMVRPRGGGFVFDRDEQLAMVRDIDMAVRLGAHGPRRTSSTWR